MKTRRFCPKCGRELLRSRVPGYTYECKNCDEDFYRTEVHLIPDSEGEEKIIEDVYLDMLISVIDENIEKTDNYGKRVSETSYIIR